MWYNCLSVYLLKKGYAINPICSCIFIKKSQTRFEIVVIYVDNLNLVEIIEELIEITKYLKNDFEMKYFGKKICLSLLIEHFPTRVSVHQSTYIKKTLKCFNMDKNTSINKLSNGYSTT